MTLGLTWKLVKEDSTVDEFIDMRRVVGNQVIRAYLLDDIIQKNRIIRIAGKMRGPKNEFKDFANFLIIRFNLMQSEFKVLVESGVYDNLRIVGTDSPELAKKLANDLIKIFTDALEHPEQKNTTLIISNDSKII